MVGLDSKNGSKDYENSLKRVKTANPNSPWANIRKGLLSEGYLHLRFGGLIFGRAYFRGGGVAHYLNFAVYLFKRLFCWAQWSLFSAGQFASLYVFLSVV